MLIVSGKIIIALIIKIIIKQKKNDR